MSGAYVVLPWSLLVSDNDRTELIRVRGRLVPRRPKAYRVRQQAIMLEATRQYPGRVFVEPVSVRFDFWLPNRRKRDTVNLAKHAMDSLKGVLFADDDWKSCPDVRFVAAGVDQENPRVEVSVAPCGTLQPGGTLARQAD